MACSLVPLNWFQFQFSISEKVEKCFTASYARKELTLKEEAGYRLGQGL